MRKIIVIFVFIALTYSGFGQASKDVPVGHWREHLAYYSAHAVANLGDRMLLAAESSLFFVDKKSGEMERFSKVAGLSDAGVNLLAYDPQTKTIIITYTNANIDIVQNGKVYNISDIRLKTIEGSKEINQIVFADGKAYLACGFGIVVLNLGRHEIYDTYFIGHNASAIRVNQIAINDTSIFAATDKYGILYAPRNHYALAVSDTWKQLDQFPTTYVPIMTIKIDTLPDTSIQIDTLYSIDTITANRIFTLSNGNLIVGMNRLNTISGNTLRFDGTSIDTIFTDENINKIFLSENKVVKISWKAVNIYDEDFVQLNAFTEDTMWNPSFRYNGEVLPMDINDAVMDGEKIWFAHQNLGLIGINNYRGWREKASEYYPNGPLLTDAHAIRAGKDGTMYVAPTAFGGWREANLYTFDDNLWYSLAEKEKLKELELKGVCDVAIDPRDPNHLMLASWWNGIIEVRNNKIVEIWDETNTNGILQRTYGLRCSKIEYDKHGNLLVTNSAGDYGLSFLNMYNEWGGFYTSDIVGDNDIMGFVIDTFTNYKLLWTIGTKLVLLDNEGRKLYIDPNNGAKDKTSHINFAVQDLDGEIWLGTEKGIKVIYSLADAFTTNIGQDATIECNNIVYDDNGVLQYLLNFENIKCIMIDGANRKWIGTERNGIYVYSPNGSQELLHFTAENSPLLSNNVSSMAQNPLTGEVFIATDHGIVSYKAESTKGAEEAGSLTAFPNPVRPDYTGDIAIRGFVTDSDVKITDVSGNIVAHLKSIGGQAIWDGCNMKKEKVSSGVYLIFGSAKEGAENAVGKILIIR
ncbi:MAG: hypothetical protein LBO06_06130 [Bacteroidales bacterium]|jgi:hypothetical protein|nr:hypothetical protein [Bacteroidales bacterium]